MKLIKHAKKKRTITIRMSEEEFCHMYDTLNFTIFHREGRLDDYTESFSEIWNEVCKNFEVNK